MTQSRVQWPAPVTQSRVQRPALVTQSTVAGICDSEQSTIARTCDSEQSTVAGTCDLEQSTVAGTCDSEQSTVVCTCDSEHSTVAGTCDSEHSTVAGTLRRFSVSKSNVEFLEPLNDRCLLKQILLLRGTFLVFDWLRKSVMMKSLYGNNFPTASFELSFFSFFISLFCFTRTVNP